MMIKDTTVFLLFNFKPYNTMKKKTLILALFCLTCGCDGVPVDATQLPCQGDECPPCIEGCKDHHILVTCTDDGKPVETECPGGCAYGICYPAEEFCTDGETQCFATNVMTVCEGGRWIYTPCEFPCRNGQCGVCHDGDTKCLGSELQTCIDGQWVSETCVYGCQDNACIEPECTNEPATCISEDARQFCLKGFWHTEVCASGICFDGQCVTPIPPCNEGESTCLDIITREYCLNNELLTEKCDYMCENGECVPEPPPECYSGQAYCIDDITLRACEDRHWVDMKCEYMCENNMCISEDEDYTCPEGASGCMDDQRGFKCMGKGWATRPCEGGCTGAFCQDKLMSCTGGTECRNAEVLMVCIDGHFTDIHCPPGQVCIDNECLDANSTFVDPRAGNPLCISNTSHQQEVCDSLFGKGKCVQTASEYTYYCIGACDPNDPHPYMCENHYPYKRAFTGSCQKIVDGTYAFIPQERYLCKHSCDPDTGCDEIVPVGGGHLRDDCTDVENSCNGSVIHLCAGLDITYDCKEAFGDNWTCATHQGEVLCAEPCTFEGEVLSMCMNLPTGSGLTPTNYTKTCRRFDDGNLYYHLAYGEVCGGECNTLGTRCIDQSNHPDCANRTLIYCENAGIDPAMCAPNQVCVSYDGQPWCAWLVDDYDTDTAFCATNNTTNKTIYQEYHYCQVRNYGTGGLDIVKVEYTENCADSGCTAAYGCDRLMP